jgi:hypothetical protein
MATEEQLETINALVRAMSEATARFFGRVRISPAENALVIVALSMLLGEAASELNETTEVIVDRIGRTVGPIIDEVRFLDHQEMN